MSRKHQLRGHRTGTVINLTSKKQETRIGQALLQVETRLQKNFDFVLEHKNLGPSKQSSRDEEYGIVTDTNGLPGIIAASEDE